MAASTFIKKSNLATKGMIRSLCATTTDLLKGNTFGVLSSVCPAGTAAGGCFPGGITSTAAGDVIRFPVRSEDSKMVFYIFTDSVCASSSSFLGMAIRKPQHTSTIQDASPAWGCGKTIGTSTEAAGWEMFYTTKCIIATTTEAEAFIAGPFESMKYAMNFGGTSTGAGSTKGIMGYESKHYIEKNQNYFECMFALATGGITGITAASTGTWLEFSSATGTTDGRFCVVPIEIP